MFVSLESSFMINFDEWSWALWDLPKGSEENALRNVGKLGPYRPSPDCSFRVTHRLCWDFIEIASPNIRFKFILPNQNPFLCCTCREIPHVRIESVNSPPQFAARYRLYRSSPDSSLRVIHRLFWDFSEIKSQKLSFKSISLNQYLFLCCTRREIPHFRIKSVIVPSQFAAAWHPIGLRRLLLSIPGRRREFDTPHSSLRR
jgi:hypothetical protein